MPRHPSREKRQAIADNIRRLRNGIYPGRGGATRCAADYGVPVTRWSPWENGSRTPGEERLKSIAAFFKVGVEEILAEPPRAEPPSAPLNGGGGAPVAREAMELVELLLRSQGEAAAGIRDREGTVSKLGEILRYARYVLEAPEK
ncbi:MAG: helix-turn-helix domain-containing protein [Planctomycetota bacterium]|jgi:transcriptional regulator with XRE-family HTH domain|nr:helix-turn-helix domain-containing protein [Planctomycetota bacterium]